MNNQRKNKGTVGSIGNIDRNFTGKIGTNENNEKQIVKHMLPSAIIYGNVNIVQSTSSGTKEGYKGRTKNRDETEDETEEKSEEESEDEAEEKTEEKPTRKKPEKKTNKKRRVVYRHIDDFITSEDEDENTEIIYHNFPPNLKFRFL